MAPQGKEGHSLYHHDRICISPGCGTHHQIRCDRLPAQAGTQRTSVGTGRGCIPTDGYRTEAGKKLFHRTSPKILQVEKYARLVAPSEMSVMVLGANGTGKESVAQSIHQGSERWNMPFVAVNCGALPRELAASLFFGHEKGAFTGADTAKTGYFDMAKGGTLFLDEIGTMSYETQSMLLRVLQENTYTPIGSGKERVADVRIVSATNEDLQQAIKEGAVQGRPLSPPLRVRDPPAVVGRLCGRHHPFGRILPRTLLERTETGDMRLLRTMPSAECSPTRGRAMCVNCKTRSSVPYLFPERTDTGYRRFG